MAKRNCHWDVDCGFPARFKVWGGGIDSYYWFCSRHYDQYIGSQHCSPTDAWKWDAVDGTPTH
jgi:hypothetical protein